MDRSDRLVALVVALLALVASPLAPPAGAAQRQDGGSVCLVAAHRGEWSTHTPNGLPAMRSAIAAGADYLETDLRATKDGHLVLMHDRRLATTTNGTGLVRNKTLAQIRQLRLDDGSRVPTLAEFFATAKPSGVRVLVDVKAMGGLSRYKALRAQVNAFGRWRVRVTSFSTARLDRLAAIAPAIPLGFITRERVTAAQVAPYDSVLIKVPALTSEWLDTMPYPVFVWTVNRRSQLWTLHADRLAAVITNDLNGFLDWRRTQCRRADAT